MIKSESLQIHTRAHTCTPNSTHGAFCKHFYLLHRQCTEAVIAIIIIIIIIIIIAHTCATINAMRFSGPRVPSQASRTRMLLLAWHSSSARHGGAYEPSFERRCGAVRAECVSSEYHWCSIIEWPHGDMHARWHRHHQCCCRCRHRCSMQATPRTLCAAIPAGSAPIRGD